MQATNILKNAGFNVEARVTTRPRPTLCITGNETEVIKAANFMKPNKGVTEVARFTHESGDLFIAVTIPA